VNVLGYVQWALDGMGVQAGRAVAALPSSPFSISSGNLAPIQAVMGPANYFFPVGLMATEVTGVVVCILVWFIARFVLRWIKVAAD
jgi:hypothetical protein